MALLRATYLDIPVQQRRKSAALARARYQAALADPTLSKELREQLTGLLRQIAKWEAGTLPVKNA